MPYRWVCCAYIANNPFSARCTHHLPCMALSYSGQRGALTGNHAAVNSWLWGVHTLRFSQDTCFPLSGWNLICPQAPSEQGQSAWVNFLASEIGPGPGSQRPKGRPPPTRCTAFIMLPEDHCLLSTQALALVADRFWGHFWSVRLFP